MSRLLTMTFTTAAFDRSSSWLFEAFPYRAEGYPSTIPPPVPNCRARGLYEFRYTAEKSSASVTADRFTLVAVPIPQQIPRSLRTSRLRKTDICNHQILTKDTLRIVATTYLNRSPKRTGSIILERDKSTCLVTRKPSICGVLGRDLCGFAT